MDLNRASILGRITQDPEVRTTTNGQTVTNISVATNRVWNDRSGVKQERAEFHNVVLWGRLGEIAGQYLAKGRRVYLEGRLETRDWVGNDGVKRYRTEIIGENMIMLDGARGAGAMDGGSSAMQDDSLSGPPSHNMSESPARMQGPSSVDDEIKVEDIPF